ncbi:MAG: preprotein translocase subunit SecE [bacterium]
MKKFINETRTELKQVTWPTRRHVIWFTATVIIISLLVAYTLGLFDTLFTGGVAKILNK